MLFLSLTYVTCRELCLLCCRNAMQDVRSARSVPIPTDTWTANIQTDSTLRRQSFSRTNCEFYRLVWHNSWASKAVVRLILFGVIYCSQTHTHIDARVLIIGASHVLGLPPNQGRNIFGNPAQRWWTVELIPPQISQVL